MSVGARTLVLGLGNECLCDDGVGLVAARRVAELAGDRAELVEACVPTVDLVTLLSGYDRVVVVDAFWSPELRPGTAVHATPDDLPSGFGYRSIHTMPFREMLDLGKAVGYPMPATISIHGLNVEDARTFGERFTPAVEDAWRGWAEAIARAEFGATSATPAG